MTTPFQDHIRFESYRPTRSTSGPSDGTIYRGENMIPRGLMDPFWENIKSPLDLSEAAGSFTLTGTVATTNGSNTIVGTGTSFTTELIRGDFVVVSRRIVRVRRVTDNTHFEGSVTWAATASGLTAKMPRRMRSVDDRRFTLRRGNLIKLPAGHLLGVGIGSVLRDGAALPGGGFSLDKKPRIAIFDGTNYTPYDLGAMTVALGSTFTVSETAGGLKNMAQATYTLRFAPARLAALSNGVNIGLGYGNPSAPVTVSTTTNGKKIHIVFPAMDTTHGQNAWRIYVSRSPDSVQGPWFYLGYLITSTMLGGTGAGTTYDIEWLDGEVEEQALASFDNDPAPDAGFITLTLDARPVLYSCVGEGSTTPGPFIYPGKRDNLEAFPVDWKVALPQDIVGVVSGIGRDYPMTGANLHIASPSGDPKSPVAVRPFWQVGFYHSDQLVFVQDQLIGWTKAGPRRSADEGAEGSERFDFAEDVTVTTAGWNYEHVFAAHDPRNESVCFFHPSPTVNAAGNIETECMAFHLRHNKWSTLIKLAVDGQDIIVSGAAGVNGALDFVANEKNYEHDGGSAPVSWYLASHFLNQGSDGVMKSLDGFSLVGRTTSGKVGIFGYGSDEDAPDVTQPASSSLTGAIALDNATTPRRHQYEEVALNELAAYAMRVEGTYSGTGERNRVEVINTDGQLHAIGSF